MTFFILFINILISFLLVLFGRKKTASYFLGLSVFLFLLIGQGWFPTLLLNELQKQSQLRDYSWQDQNAIVLLGSGTVKWPESKHISTHRFGYSRLHETARLYFECKEKNKVCKVFLTGGDPNRNGLAEATVMQTELLEIGVQKADVYLENKSNNTFENAKFTSKILSLEGFKTAIIVTSGLHLKRSLLYFSHFGVTTIGSPADRIEAISSIFPISYNFFLSDLAIHEYLGVVRYYIYNLLGWNVKIIKPGTP